MPISISDVLKQTGRSGSVGSSSFYPLVESQDVNFSVEMIVTGNDCSGNVDLSPTGIGKKYIIGPSSCLTPSTTPTLGTWDIVMYTSDGWELYQDVSNTETNHGLVYDRRTQRFLQYSGNSSLGWIPMIRSGGIDGGTFT
jgi:hypothetical protein